MPEPELYSSRVFLRMPPVVSVGRREGQGWPRYGLKELPDFWVIWVRNVIMLGPNNFYRTDPEK